MSSSAIQNVKQEAAEDLTVAEDDTGDAPSEEMIPRNGNKLRSSDKKSYFAKCKICGKEGKRDSIKTHVRSAHGGSTNEGVRAEFKNEKTIPKKVPMKPISLPPDFSRDNINYYDFYLTYAYIEFFSPLHNFPPISIILAKMPTLPFLATKET